MTTTFQVASAEPAHAPRLARLFASNGYGCYCRYWHFAGTAREWLARCAGEPRENAEEMAAKLDEGSLEMRGVVAWEESPGGAATQAALPETALPEAALPELVGWLKLAPAEAIPKLYGQRLYKGLPVFDGDRSGTYAVACLFVREDLRRQGVARALLAGAVAAAPGWGARRLEAFPRSDTDVPGSALMTGPSQLFLDAGFRVVHEFHPYPVLRLELPRGTS